MRKEKKIEDEAGGGPGNARGAAMGSAGGRKMQAPLADREPVDHVIHGDRRVDHYAWMKNKKDPRVRAYLEAENAYADAQMEGTEAFQEKLYQEMLGRIQQTDLSVPYLLRGYEYYTRTEEGKQYPIYCRRPAVALRTLAGGSSQAHEPEHEHWGEDKLLQELRAELRKEFAEDFQRREDPPFVKDAKQGSSSKAARQEESVAPEEEILLDLNVLATGHTYMGLGIFEVSDDNRYLAYATDTTGFRQYELEVKDLESGTLIPFHAERVTSAAWAMDSRTLFYVTEDEVTKRSNQLWRHRLEERAGGQAGPPHGTQRREQAPAASLGMPRSPEDVAHMGLGGTGPLAQALLPVPQAKPRDGGLHPPRPERDELLFEERDERFRMELERSRSGAYLFLVVNSHTTSEVRYLRADSPLGRFQLVAEREDEHEYYLDHHPGSASDPAGGVFFIRTNSGGRTYRLVTAPAVDPVRSRWHEVIGNRPGVMLAGLAVFRTHLVLTEREDGLPHLRIVDLTKQAASALAASQRLQFAEPAYNAMVGTNPEFVTQTMRFQYESMVTPRSVYDYELKTGKWILKKRQPVLGDFDTANYLSERLHAKTADGTLIPVSVVRRKDTVRDGNAPLLLYGYGSYGLSMPAVFSSNRLSLLDRGLVYAIAHVRGGGELGKPWHDAGRMHQKMNTFTDFLACADFLMAKRYTSPEGLVIEGGSAGGLLMGAVANLRPEMFRAVVSHVPFVDVLNTMLDASLPLTVGEYEEWGNPGVAEDYFYMKKYCPYTNLERKSFPRMLVKTAWNDSQVMYWEAAKYVAILRTMTTDGNVLLLMTNMGAGHGGASGRYDFLREIAMDYAFVLREVGRGEVEERGQLRRGE
jgi:protease II